MLDKKAKVILRKIKEDADRGRTYYVILESFWVHGSGNDPRRTAFKMGADDKVWADIYKLNKRYKAFCNYLNEIKPEWKDIDTIHYADNSIEVVQENNQGKRRTIMTKAPSGDICF